MYEDVMETDGKFFNKVSKIDKMSPFYTVLFQFIFNSTYLFFYGFVIKKYAQ